MDHIIFTFIGDDRPGIVEKIAGVVERHQANWLESRLSQLAGKFAGIIQVEIDPSHIEALTEELRNLTSAGLTVVAERSSPREAAPTTHTLSLIGLDRPGIIRDISGALAEQNINVLELNTRIIKAAMTGEPMFEARAVVAYASDSDLVELSEELDRISTELGVDIDLSEEDETV
ncbi:MAG: ACT domain-containing protein [Proteobacteria bacterium]|nr:ACT domain-containing protein [Pseudomonadota bacterium]